MTMESAGKRFAKAHKRTARGSTSLMAMLFLSMFSVLAISFASLTETNVQMAQNHRSVTAAQAAAESGLEYAQYLLTSFEEDLGPSTYFGKITKDDTYNVFDLLSTYVGSSLAKSGILNSTGDGQSSASISIRSISDGSQTGKELYVPAISYAAGGSASFSLQFRQFDDDPFSLQIISIGNNSGISRSVGLNYTITVDKSILEYGVASRSRVIITGDSTINSDVFTAWDHPELGSPVEMDAASTIEGSVNTMLSEGDFPADDINGTYEEINYDQPDIVGLMASDFDTSMYLNKCNNLSSSGTTLTEYFPHAAGDYTKPADAGSAKLSRQVYEKLTITNRNMPTGRNALFRNCVFEGVFYLGSGGGSGTNNLRFENCTFNGIIVTAPAATFAQETWKKNVLYFTGSSYFNNRSAYQEATILAPNFNVNIGDTKTYNDGTESVLKGVVLGGVVDIRGNARVEGTIISMAYPDPDSSWTSAAGKIATNIGYSAENTEAGLAAGGKITISPDPDGQMPMGVKARIIIIRDAESYVEY